MEKGKEISLILLLLIVAYIGINYVQEASLTGNVVLEGHYENIADGLELDDNFEWENGIRLKLVENRTSYIVEYLNLTLIESAYRGDDDKTSKVIADDDKEYELKDGKELNITFPEVLENGDVISVLSKSDNDKGLVLCSMEGDCGIANREFNSGAKTYNFTINNLGEESNAFYLTPDHDVKLDYIYGLKKNVYEYEINNDYYPEYALVESEMIGLPELATLHNIIAEDEPGNGSISYEYSLDGVNWLVLTNPLEIATNKLWVRAGFYSNGSTPVLNSLWVNYSNCVSECFPSKINIEREALISVMGGESVELNASFTNIELTPSELQINKSFAITEYDEKNVSSGKLPAKRFVDITSEITGFSSISLKVYYEQEDIEDAEINESSIRLYYLNESNWIALNTTLNMDSNYAQASLEHFSTYGLFGDGIDSGTTTASGSSGSGGGGSSGSIRRAGSGITSTTLAKTSMPISTSTTIQETTTTIVGEIEGNEATDSGMLGTFRGMTGRVVNAGKKMVKMPNLILFSVIMVLAISYLVMRVRWVRGRKAKRLERASRKKG